jgi:hypothetical protein
MNELLKKIKELFEGVELSEETLLKLKLIFETAVQERTDVITEEAKARETSLQEAAEAHSTYLQEQAEAYGEYITEELTAKADEYAKFAVEKFVEEHKKEIVDAEDVKKYKAIFEDVKAAFEKNLAALTIDSTGSDEIASLHEQIDEQKAQYSDLFEQFVDAKKQLEEKGFAEIFESLTVKLADTQKEKINNLLEHISFTDQAEFKKAVEILVEEILSASQKKEPITEEVDPKAKVNEKMKAYLNRL